MDAWSMPGLNLDKIQLQDHWIGLSGVELALKDGPALHTISAIPKAPNAFPAPPRMLEPGVRVGRSEEHTSELQSPDHLVCRLLLEKKKKTQRRNAYQLDLDSQCR